MNQYGLRSYIGRYGVEFACEFLGLVYPGNHNRVSVKRHIIIIDAWVGNVILEIKTGSDPFKIRIEQLEDYKQLAQLGTQVVYVFLSCKKNKQHLASLSRPQLEKAVADTLWRMFVIDHRIVAAIQETGWASTKHYPDSNWKSVMIINHGKKGLGALAQNPARVLQALSLEPSDYQVWQSECKGVMFQNKTHNFQFIQILQTGKVPFPRKKTGTESSLPLFSTLPDSEQSQWKFVL